MKFSKILKKLLTITFSLFIHNLKGFLHAYIEDTFYLFFISSYENFPSFLI